MCTFRRLITTAEKARHKPAEVANSVEDGGNTRTKPLPFMRDEKLETQKGMANKRKVCQRSFVTDLIPPMLRINATPMTALIPIELSQMFGDGSKWWKTVEVHQIR